MNREMIKRAVILLFQMYDRTFDNQITVANEFIRQLSHFSDSVVERVINQWITNENRFPRLSQLVEICRQESKQFVRPIVDREKELQLQQLNFKYTNLLKTAAYDTCQSMSDIWDELRNIAVDMGEIERQIKNG